MYILMYIKLMYSDVLQTVVINIDWFMIAGRGHLQHCHIVGIRGNGIDANGQTLCIALCFGDCDDK